MAGKKEIITKAAVALLEQRRYKDITVLDIVSESRVNRNTFYYHFGDMEALVEQLALRAIDNAFASQNVSLEGKLSLLVDTIYNKRELIFHVYDSADRIDFDKGLDAVCEHLAKLLSVGCAAEPKDAEKRQLLYKACCCGMMCDWLNKELREDRIDVIKQLCGEMLNIL